jgi:hypothetical protein
MSGVAQVINDVLRYDESGLPPSRGVPASGPPQRSYTNPNDPGGGKQPPRQPPGTTAATFEPDQPGRNRREEGGFWHGYGSDYEDFLEGVRRAMGGKDWTSPLDTLRARWAVAKGKLSGERLARMEGQFRQLPTALSRLFPEAFQGQDMTRMGPFQAVETVSAWTTEHPEARGLGTRLKSGDYELLSSIREAQSLFKTSQEMSRPNVLNALGITGDHPDMGYAETFARIAGRGGESTPEGEIVQGLAELGKSLGEKASPAWGPREFQAARTSMRSYERTRKATTRLQELQRSRPGAVTEIIDARFDEEMTKIQGQREALADAREKLLDELGPEYQASRRLREFTPGGRQRPLGKVRERALQALEFANAMKDQTGVEALTSYVKSLDETEDLDAKQVALGKARTEALAEEGGGVGARLGRAARRMLGGFGLMYIRSMLSLVGQGMGGGYDAYMQQEQATYAQLGARLGGMPMRVTPEQYIQGGQAMQGGGGLQAFRMLYGDMLRSPLAGVAPFGGSLLAGASAFGGTAWALGSMGAKEATIGKWAPAVGVMVGAASYMANLYGAAQDVRGSSIGLASKLSTGMYAPVSGTDVWGALASGDIQGGIGKAITGIGTRISALDPQVFAAKFLNPEVGDQAAFLTAMRTFVRTGMGTPADFLRQNKITNPADVAKYMGLYASVTAASFRDLPPEATMQAVGLSFQYGVNLTDPQLGRMSAMLAQGVPLEQTARAAAASPWTSLAQQYQGAGKLMASWTESGLTPLQAEQYTTGAQRYAALGPLAPQFAGVGGQAIFEQQLAGLTGNQFDVYQRQYALYSASQLYGGSMQRPLPEEVGGVKSAQDYAREIQKLSLPEYREQLRTQLGGNLTALGMGGEAVAGWKRQTEGWATGRMQLEIARSQAALNFSAQAAANGFMSPEMAQGAATQMFTGGMNVNMMQLQTQAANWNFGALTQLNAMGVPLQGYGLTPWYMAQGNIGQFGSLQGMATGQPWGATSYQWGNPYANGPAAGRTYAANGMPTGLTAQEIGVMAWGYNAPSQPLTLRGWEGRITQGMFRQAALSGLQLPGYTDPLTGQPLVVGGQMALGLMQNQLSLEAARASAGNQMAQLQLGFAFTTGVGLDQYAGIINPQTGQPFNFNIGPAKWNVPGVGKFTSEGGGFWGYEDALRQLSYAQTKWGFQQQAAQMEMQRGQFYENFGLNFRQAQMQRGWAREDWAFQDQTRSMQWEWRQEDFQEEARFMTGRQRRLAERQMRRETLMHNLEGDQIDKQRQRQEELWKLEDERFILQRKHFEENLEFQKKALETQKKFFEERKRLEEEMNELQRAYWTKQHELQQAAVGSQLHYAELQAQLLEDQTAIQTLALTIQALQTTMTTDQEKANDALDRMMKMLYERASEILGMDPSGGWGNENQNGGGGGTGGIGQERYAPTNFQSTFSNPWEGTILTAGNKNRQRESVTIVLNVGDQHIKSMVLDTVSQEVNI